MLYEMLGGQKPFAGQSPVEVMARHIRDPLPSLYDRCPGLPEGVTRLVDWMTAKAPNARPPSYADLLPQLSPETASGSSDLGASATSTMPTPARALSVAGAQRSRRTSRRRAVWLLAAAGVAITAGGFGFTHWKPRHGSFAVAVVPFFGPDADSEREGRMLASMIEGELLQRLPEGQVDVLGLD